MPLEWSKENEFCSFNTRYKSLTYFDRYREINKWRLDKTYPLPPPIEISLDPIALCTLKCDHCNFGKYLENDIPDRVGDEHLFNLLRFFSRWEVKNYKIESICFGGGGSPTLHSKLWDALLFSHKLGIANSIATNALNFNDETALIVAKTCRWVGVSVDASNKETYKIGRKGDYFNKVIENIKRLVRASDFTKEKNILDVGFKFLIFDYNQHEIYEACKLAKSLGVKDFHCRPADFRHQGLVEWKEKNKFYDIDLINKQFEECRKLEDKNFRVFLITHKFNPNDFTPIKEFNTCGASPLCLQINPSGMSYLCPDTRNLDFYKLGTHYSNPENILTFWGKENHWDLVFNKGRKNCKSRCTFGLYTKDFETLFINNYDPLCRGFI